MTVSLNNFWGSNYYNHPQLTDEIISTVEDTLQIILPDDYLNLLKIMNGGYTNGFALPMSQATCWAEDHIPVGELYGIFNDESNESPFNILDNEYMITEWELPKKLILISGGAHNWIALDYRNSAVPSIVWIDTECEDDIQVANNFSEFFNNLVPKENYDEE